MSRNNKLGLIALLILFAGIGLFMLSQTSKNDSPQSSLEVNPSPAQTGQTLETPSEAQLNVAASSYLEFSEAVLSDSNSKRRVLFFYANWCPTCKAAEQDIQANIDELPDDVIIIRVNYNDADTDENEKELAKNYAITYQHTFVHLDAQNNAVKTWNGGQVKEIIENLN